MLDQISSLSKSLLDGSEVSVPFPDHLKLSKVQKEILFRIKSLRSWKKLLKSNENREESQNPLTEIRSLLTTYKLLLKLKTFSEANLQLMQKIDKTSLYLIHPTVLFKFYQIIEYPRSSLQGKQKVPIIDQLPSDIQCKLGRHTSVVSDAILSLNSTLLIYSSYDYSIRFWYIPVNQTIKVLSGHSNYVNTLALTSDEKFLFSGSSDGKVFIWDLEKSLKITELKVDSVPVLKVCVSNNDNFLAISDYSGRIFIYSVSLALQNYSLTGKVEISGPLSVKHDKIVKTLIFSSNNRFLFAGSLSKGILVFNLKTTQKMTLEGHSEVINDLKVYDLDQRLISVSQDLHIKVWDLNNFKLIKSIFSGFQEYLSSVVVSDQTKKAFIAGKDPFLLEIDLIQVKVIKKIEIQMGFINRLVLVNDNDVVACNDHVICYKTDSQSTGFEIMLDRRVRVVSWDYFEGFFVGINYENQVFTFDLNTNKIEIVKFSGDRVKSAAFTWDKRYLAFLNEEKITVFKNR